MARFGVYRLASGELVVDCQTDELSTLPTRFVIPLLDRELVPNPVKGLHPVFGIEGREMLLATHAAAAMSRNHLGEPLLSLEPQRYAILNALDFLITGV
jgi:toxin CcdB